MRPALFVALVAAFAACAHAPAVDGSPVLPATAFPATDHQFYRLPQIASHAQATVVEFFSASCPCQASHDARLIALYERYRSQGVQFVVVDSNRDASLESDAAEAVRRNYPFPILVDPRGALLDALGARFATYSVVLDAQSRVRYRGGFDSDRHPITDEAKPWLDQAVASVLAGRDPDPAVTKSLGCSLERW